MGGPSGPPPQVTNPSEAARLTLYRDNSPIGIFGTMRVTLNDRDIYQLGMGQSYQIPLDPGDYRLEYRIGLNECAQSLRLRPYQQLRLQLIANCTMRADL